MLSEPVEDRCADINITNNVLEHLSIAYIDDTQVVHIHWHQLQLIE